MNKYISNFISYKTNILVILLTLVYLVQYIVINMFQLIELTSISYHINSFNIITAVISTVLHTSFEHYLFNIVVLLIVGYTIENYVSTREFYGLFIIGSVIIDLFLSIMYSFLNESFYLVGASGGISVLVGVSVGIYYKHANWGKYSPISLLYNRLPYNKTQLELTYTITVYILAISLFISYIHNFLMYGNSSTIVYMSHIYGFSIGILYQIIT